MSISLLVAVVSSKLDEIKVSSETGGMFGCYSSKDVLS